MVGVALLLYHPRFTILCALFLSFELHFEHTKLIIFYEEVKTLDDVVLDIYIERVAACEWVNVPCACHSKINVFFHLSHSRVYISSVRSLALLESFQVLVPVLFQCYRFMHLSSFFSRSISGEIILWSLRLIAYLFCPYASLLFIKHPAMKWLASRSFTVKKNCIAGRHWIWFVCLMLRRSCNIASTKISIELCILLIMVFIVVVFSFIWTLCVCRWNGFSFHKIPWPNRFFVNIRLFYPANFHFHVILCSFFDIAIKLWCLCFVDLCVCSFWFTFLLSWNAISVGLRCKKPVALRWVQFRFEILKPICIHHSPPRTLPLSPFVYTLNRKNFITKNYVSYLQVPP